MKQDFSTEWRASKNRRKQRKFIANAPLHLRGSFLNTQLSKTLSKKHGLRSIRIRKGDKVKITTGQHKGKSGAIAKVDVKNTRVNIETLFTLKRDGSKSFYPVHPSNLQIQELNMDDRKRNKKLESLSKTKETKETKDKK
ncbi:50S ribosomal protein L24 [Candidatus Woesearchaeota archaeon]|jgi:large subunit ribosomal protein L24|nr:50S ribosomal protein L24 [Candidatus Woesearchaeota archaeon]MBT6044947.1 50S ribosomal protein L24 [Candidatus Woesearchaeota archaeon]